jgi:hypothetical protein
MRKPRGRHRRCPYYKVQLFNQVSMTWQDERTVSETIAEAEQYIAKKGAGQLARIVAVEEAGRRILSSVRS